MEFSFCFIHSARASGAIPFPSFDSSPPQPLPPASSPPALLPSKNLSSGVEGREMRWGRAHLPSKYSAAVLVARSRVKISDPSLSFRNFRMHIHRRALYSTRLYSESEGQLEKQSIQTRLLHSLARKAKALPHFPPSALGEGKEI